MIAVQYLEPGPETGEITPTAARRRLRLAFERLPFTMVMLGWNLPPSLVEACFEETSLLGAQLYRWQPLLTGDGILNPEPGWRVTGLEADEAADVQGKPEFTFICPNKPMVRQAVVNHLDTLMHEKVYQGFFLDRIRFPSPTGSPDRLLACFCSDCQAAAAEEGFDLKEVEHVLRSWRNQPGGSLRLLDRLLASRASSPQPVLVNEVVLVDRFIKFRKSSVTRMVQAVYEMAARRAITVGLDCFSPCLAGIVGQDLVALHACSDWIKVMTYGHTFAPAGLPFELSHLAGWLEKHEMLDEVRSLAILSQITGLPLPENRSALIDSGLSSKALGMELSRARAIGLRPLLAGIELVDLPDVTRINPVQIQADLAAFRSAGADGLVLSWDLWRIPLERLNLVTNQPF